MAETDFFEFFPMEFNFPWKIYRQGQYDNAHVFMPSAWLVLVVEMTSKKNSRNRVDVALTQHFFLRKICAREQRLRKFTEKVQVWKLFSEKTLVAE